MNKKLQTAIKKSGYRREYICEQIGISTGQLSNVLHEKHSPSLKIIKGLMKVLNKKFEDLF